MLKAALTIVLTLMSMTALASKPGAGPATTIEEARRLAKDVDLPALATADHAVLTIYNASEGPRTVTVKGKDLDALRAALVVSERMPTGNKNAGRIVFMQGEVELRSVWLFDDGEWGFDRPGTAWTTGRSPGLWKLVLSAK